MTTSKEHAGKPVYSNSRRRSPYQPSLLPRSVGPVPPSALTDSHILTSPYSLSTTPQPKKQLWNKKGVL